MSSLAEPMATRRDADRDGLLHSVCCDDNLALCGRDVTHEPWQDDGVLCAVCQDMLQLPCSVTCGDSP